jgi:hypothetical protein
VQLTSATRGISRLKLRALILAFCFTVILFREFALTAGMRSVETKLALRLSRAFSLGLFLLPRVNVDMLAADITLYSAREW